MPYWNSRALPLVLALTLLPPVAAADTLSAPGSVPAIEAQLQRPKAAARNLVERQQRQAVAERAGHLFTLFASEIALNRGQPAAAVAAYRILLNRTQDAAVAERGMEIALDLDARQQAEAFLQRLRELEGGPSPTQERMQWALALSRGEGETVFAGLDGILAHADERQARRIFLQLAQMGLSQPQVAADGADAVHRSAARFPDLAEAMIADAVISAQAGRNQDAVGALQRLSELDGDIRPPTQLALSLIAQRQPQVVNSFFRQTDINQLSPMWQGLYIDTLIHSGDYARAYAQLQNVLATHPDPDFYLQAALLSVNQKAPIEDTLQHLEKVTALGNQAQKGRAALLAAMRLLADSRYGEARAWLARIQTLDLRFDKAIVTARIDVEEQKWAAARQQLAAAESMGAKRGRYFDQGDLRSLQLRLLDRTLPPQQLLNQLNSQLRQAESSGDQEYLSALLYQRGVLYADQLGQPQRAVADLRRFVQLNPDSPDGMNALGYTLLSLPPVHRAEAARLIEAAYQLDQASAAINDSLGWVYFLQGDAQRALPYLQYAYEQQPEAEVAAHLGEVLWTLDQREQALTVWREAHQKDPQHRVLQETLRRLGVRLSGE